MIIEKEDFDFKLNKNNVTTFTITNFITEPITIRIYSIKVKGYCQVKPSQNNVEDVEEKIDLGNFTLKPGDVATEIKNPFKDFTIKMGESESFYFSYLPPKDARCSLSLVIQYTDPHTGTNATLIAQLRKF